MSHGTHTTSDPDDGPARTLPIPQRALLMVLVVILLAIMQGSFVAGSSAWGRVWPSIDSTKIQLPPTNF